jgi:hypothetical protein
MRQHIVEYANDPGIVVLPDPAEDGSEAGSHKGKPVFDDHDIRA